MTGLKMRVSAAFIVSLLLLFFGYRHSWDVFERMGSIITVIGLLSFAVGLQGLIDAEQRISMTSRLREISSRNTAPGSVEEMRKFIDIVSVTPDEEAAAITQRKAKTAELFLVVFGTLVWGWGSYLGKL